MPIRTLDDLKLTLATSARGLLFISENEAGFTPVVLSPDASAERPMDANDLRRRFAVSGDTPISERSLDDFFSYGTQPDPADAAASATSARIAALRDTLRSIVPDIKAFRVGAGPEVRYLILGHARLPGTTADGAIAGVETIGFES